ncbi:MAG: undecaprenyl-diphosphate phosphatase [Sinobacteraceae bacterium]|nr:undecaprenyl-diphosphate phosphatase [Nevskiaceae bacterium]
MNDSLQALLLGVIEGITEFLPISSTGHLLIAEHWLGARSDFFNVVIQSAAFLAVLWIYRQRLWTLLRGWREPDHFDYLAKLAAAFCVTAAGGLLAKHLGFRLPERLSPVAWALLLGGLFIFGAEWRAGHARQARSEISWGVALFVGAAQILAAVFPGTSRSLCTIFAAMLAGVSSRPAATEFSFLLGIPTMFAASGLELYEVLRSQGTGGEDWSATAIAFAAAGVSAYLAVRWLLGFIRTHRFTVFGAYRVALGAALLLFFS